MSSQPSPDFWLHTPQKPAATARTLLGEPTSTATLASSSTGPVSRGDCEVSGSPDSAGSLKICAPGRVVDAADSGHAPSPPIGTENPTIPQVAGEKKATPEKEKKKKSWKRPRIQLHEVFESTPKPPKTPKATKEKRALPKDKPTKKRKYTRKNKSTEPLIEEISSIEQPSVQNDVAVKASVRRGLDFDLGVNSSECPQTWPFDNTSSQVAESALTSVEVSNLESPPTWPSHNTSKQVAEPRYLDGPLMRTCRSLMQLRCRCCLCRLDKIPLAFPKECKRKRTSIRVTKARRRRILPTGKTIHEGFKCTLALTRSLLQCTQKRMKRTKRLNQEAFQQAIRWLFDSPNKAKVRRGKAKEAPEPKGKDKKATKKRATKKTKAKDIWENGAIEDMVDLISEKFEKLCISCNALVVYEKKKPKGKTDFILDPETIRVSNLLKEREDDSDPVKEADEEKQKWWENQRKELWAKMYPVIVIMSYFLGDRRFSPWKGSVVDSIVGVFLTQNVSDHLSSNAFMSMVSRYPAKMSNEDIRFCKESEVASNHEQGEVIGRTMCDMQCDNKECCNESDVVSTSGNSVEQELLDKGGEKNSGSQGYIEPAALFDQVGEKDLGIASSHGSLEGSSIEQDVQLGEKDLGTASSQGSTEGSSIEQDVQLGEKDCFAAPQSMGCPDNMNTAQVSSQSPQKKTKKKGKEVEDVIDWDTLRTTYSKENNGKCNSLDTKDSVDWDAVRRADVKDIAAIISERGQHNILAEKIKNFLDRMVKDHGSTDLEWLRDVPPLKAKEYLLDIHGLGLKSVECLRLLTLHHHAFPVDTNVGRIVIRLGWVPLKPLEDSLLLHDLDNYPLMDKIQTYLWPRVCHLPREVLYETHYLAITFGKVFCTKKNPNCNACPLRNECKYYASKCARERLKLEDNKKKSGKKSSKKATRNPFDIKPSSLAVPSMDSQLSLSNLKADILLTLSSLKASNCEPIIEEPPSPEPERVAPVLTDIEDLCSEDTDEMPFYDLCDKRLIAHLNENEETSIAILSPQAASIPAPQQKKISRLRTEHLVYELPDDHPLLEGLEKRQKDDPCPYLLAIWMQDENQQEKDGCDCQEQDQLTVPGTLLIPCRSAMRGNFPLNGTYFQVNEVFADDETSRRPINVPRKWIWKLNKGILYCGSSTSAIAREIPVLRIREMFWQGYVCVRGFNRKTRAPKPLAPRFHYRVIAKKKTGKKEE